MLVRRAVRAGPADGMPTWPRVEAGDPYIHAGIGACRNGSMQAWEHASMGACRHGSMQAWGGHAGMHAPLRAHCCTL